MSARPSAMSSVQVRLSRTGIGSGISGLQHELQDMAAARRKEHGVDRDRVAAYRVAAAQLDLARIVDARRVPDHRRDLREVHRFAKSPPVSTWATFQGMQEGVDPLAQVFL